MQQNEIVVFAPSMDLMQLLKELQDESSFPFTLQFGLYDGAIAQARQAMEDGANVLVSRGETTLLIRKELQEIPVVDLDISDSDTLEILMQARDFGGPIAILGYGPFLRGARRIMPFLKLDVPYEIFQLTNVAEVEGIMRDIIRRGFRVAVGNPFAVKIGI